MGIPSHLQMINSAGRRMRRGTFSRFQELPVEIRLMIWKLLVDPNRLISVQIKVLSDDPSEPTRTPSENYTLDMELGPTQSVLLRVNRESRSVALKFYRVHLPFNREAKFEPSGSVKVPMMKQILYFNPEHDTLCFSCYDCSNCFAFPKLLQDLFHHDPNHVGLMNWGIDGHFLSGLDNVIEKSKGSVRDTLLRHISGIQNIYFMSNCNRKVIGALQCYHERHVGLRFNHSIPIRPRTTIFYFGKPDPRDINQDLKAILTTLINPQQARITWHELQKRWPLAFDKPAANQHLIVANDVRDHDVAVNDLPAARMFLKNEDQGWIDFQYKWPALLRLTLKRGPPVEDADELARAVKPAFGFWLFPAHILGDVEGDYRRTRILDLSSHRPDLVLADLS
ncbi:hypothetical protein VHEMI00580 [[Torrubiella] hemipterigena]|uniref:2EXR domain-containing protein n=1 Tax=[Torrubiella] hemipterigena TaxID=1531966 RepID=A0A0A1T2B9_9HYPO|nr:hypothetical protein VHEMI00580 [[Torrubiella] hemipterigena]